MNLEQSSEPTFDFDAHERQAVESYREVRPLYERYAAVVRHILDETTTAAGIRVHSIEARAKELESFGKKAGKQSEVDPNTAKYADPINQITDLSGIRVITFLPRTLHDINQIVEQEFVVLERSDKSEQLAQEDKFGYLSIHYIVKLKPERAELPEYSRFRDLVAEIQVRTILQHAWAELEHDIRYKSAIVIPVSVRRRFMALAGLFEIADREFDAIQAEDERLREEARQSVEAGRLSSVEITPDALRSYLNKRLGSDYRIAGYTYHSSARELLQMGFKDFKQLDDCLSGIDADEISRRLWGQLQGQISKFEDALLAAMGENFLRLNPWAKYEWYLKSKRGRLESMREKGIDVRSYDPTKEDAAA